MKRFGQFAGRHLVRTAAAGVLLGTLAGGTAIAADFGVKKPSPALPKLASRDWTGFHVDLFAMAGVDSTRFSRAPDAVTVSSTLAGIGGRIGYRRQFQNGVVAGVDGSVAANLNRRGQKDLPSFPPDRAQFEARFASDVRGILGFAFNQTLMAYAAAGVSILNYRGCTNFGGTCFAGSEFDKTIAGAVVAAGLAVRLSQSIYGFAEYNARFFGNQRHSTPTVAPTTTSTRTTQHEVRGGIGVIF